MRAVVLALLVACKREPSPADSGAPDPNVDFAPGTPLSPSVPLPSDWPFDVPIYAKARIWQATSQISDAGTSWDLQYEVREATSRIVDFYRQAFVGASIFEIDLAAARMIEFKKPERVVSVTVFALQGTTHVILSVQPH